MSEYISDELLEKLQRYDDTADEESFFCLRCKQRLASVVDLTSNGVMREEPKRDALGRRGVAMCMPCTVTVFDQLVAEVLRHREDAVKRAREVAPPRQRNVRYRGGRR